MTTRLRRSAPHILLAGLALGLLWLTLRSVDLQEVWAQLRGLTLTQISMLAVANLLVLLTFSARWWLLLYAQGHRVPYAKLMSYRLAAFGVSYFTPGPHFGGEPLQVYLVSARHAVPMAASLAAVLLDKTLEMLANFSFLLFGILLILRQRVVGGALDEWLIVSGSALLLLPIGLLALLASGRHPLSAPLRLVDMLWRRFSATGGWSLRRFTEHSAYRTLRTSEDQCALLFRDHPMTMLLALSASALSWLAMIGEFWLMTRVLGLAMSFEQAIFALVAARVAILLPLPAALGTLEASQVLAMNTLGLPPSAGISLSILIRVRDLLLGLLGLWIGGVAAWRR